MWASINDLVQAAWAAKEAGKFTDSTPRRHGVRAQTAEYRIYAAVAYALAPVFGFGHSGYKLMEACDQAINTNRPELEAASWQRDADPDEQEANRRTYYMARSMHDLARKLGKGWPNS